MDLHIFSVFWTKVIELTCSFQIAVSEAKIISSVFQFLGPKVLLDSQNIQSPIVSNYSDKSPEKSIYPQMDLEAG